MDQYGQTGGGGDMRVRGDHAAAGNIRLSAIPASIGRQIKWMIPLFLILAFLSFWFTKDIKRDYIADGGCWCCLAVIMSIIRSQGVAMSVAR